MALEPGGVCAGKPILEGQCEEAWFHERKVNKIRAGNALEAEVVRWVAWARVVLWLPMMGMRWTRSQGNGG
jgi:hypothetical protein